MTSDAVHHLSLMEVSGRLRRGELKPTTLSETILARIAHHDGALRSYTTLLADRAMAKARQAEAQGNLAELLRYAGPFNLTGVPALTMNGGFDQRGAPIGFQLVGKHLSEDLLLRAGHAFQSITDWHTRHPKLD
jgi:Asp-tRNA(Asn)/Glu-tRNA(Gln) amidotransferase A subunit family amidase